jgi:drug/metabolite transporter (DMT)-like permease
MKNIYFFLLFLGTVFWGLSFLVVQEGVQLLPMQNFLCFKFIFAGLALAIIFPKHVLKINKETLKASILVGFVLYFGSFLQYKGLLYTSASNTAFITGLSVVFIPFIKYFFFAKPIEKRIVLYSFLAVIGLAILTLHKNLSLNKGDFFVLISSIAFALHILFTGKFVKKVDPIGLTIAQLLICGILSIILAFSLESGIQIPQGTVVWSTILFTALLATAFMFTVQSLAQQYISEEKISIIFLLEPIVACIASVLVLNESVGLRTILGGSLILFSLYQIEKK